MANEVISTTLGDIAERNATPEGREASEDVYVTVTFNVTRVIEFFISLEDAERSEQRKEADQAFSRQLRAEVFR